MLLACGRRPPTAARVPLSHLGAATLPHGAVLHRRGPGGSGSGGDAVTDMAYFTPGRATAQVCRDASPGQSVRADRRVPLRLPGAGRPSCPTPSWRRTATTRAYQAGVPARPDTRARRRCSWTWRTGRARRRSETVCSRAACREDGVGDLAGSNWRSRCCMALLTLPADRGAEEAPYRATVRAIRARTSRLIGRDDELSTIVGFATGPAGYRWLVGGPWAGNMWTRRGGCRLPSRNRRRRFVLSLCPRSRCRRQPFSGCRRAAARGHTGRRPADG